MNVGFTGTRRGMSDPQITALIGLLVRVHILHHGDSTGADQQAHSLAIARNIQVHVHPPINASLRAYTTGWTWCEPPSEYLTRNRAIVHMSADGVIAAPREVYEVQRSGTWVTVRYARELNTRLHVKRPIWIIQPDGAVADGSVPPAKERTLADYRPQHDAKCARTRCVVCDLSAHLTHDDPSSHPFKAKPCSCGLDALLLRPRRPAQGAYPE